MMGQGRLLVARSGQVVHGRVHGSQAVAHGVQLGLVRKEGMGPTSLGPTTRQGKRFASMYRVDEQVLTGICAYTPNSCSEYPSFLESLEWVLESVPTGDTRV